MANHFIAVRAGLFEHVADGRLTPNMLVILLVILRQVDYETGMWRGSAPKVLAALGGQMSLRTIQHSIEKLCRDGYLKSFHQQGKRGNYLVAVDKYPVRFGIRKGHRLDASATSDPKAPVSLPEQCLNSSCTDDSPVTPSNQSGCTEGAVQSCTDVARIPDNQKRDTDTTSQTRMSAPLVAAQLAFRTFCEDMPSKDAFDLLLWVLFRSSRVKKSPGQVPHSVDYYLEARRNFHDGLGRDEFESCTMLDSAVDRFKKFTAGNVKKKYADLWAWLNETYSHVTEEAARAAA